MDTTAAQRAKFGNVLRSYQLEVLADDPDRVILGEDGTPCPDRPMRPVDEVCQLLQDRGVPELAEIARHLRALQRLG